MSAETGTGSILSITYKDFADCRLVQVTGRVDHSNATDFLETLGRHAEEKGGTGGLVVDLGGLEFVTSAGLRALLMAHRTLSAAGSQMIVTGLKGVVKEVFRISKFDALLAVSDTVAEAVGRISPAAREAYPG